MTSGSVRIGRVVKPHGIRGELVVEPFGETLEGLATGETVHVGGDEDTVTGVRPHQGRVLLQLRGCDDRNAAEALRDAFVELADVDLPELADDEWYADDLVGWRVLDASGREVGRVTGTAAGPAHDYLEVAGEPNALVPMVREWLIAADRDARTIQLDLPDGLVEEPSS